MILLKTGTELWHQYWKNTLQNIVSVEETALFHIAQPNRTLIIKMETCHGGEKYKDGWLTMLLCCNTGGSEKLQPLAMGKFGKSCFVKTVKNCSCEYKANKIA